MKTKGFDKLQKKLATIQKAMAELDGTIGTLSYDPHDPASIDCAISEMEAAVDARIGSYARDDFVANIVQASKESFRNGILEQAAQARLKGEDD